jgi:hypothetical protein
MLFKMLDIVPPRRAIANPTPGPISTPLALACLITAW